MLVPYSSFDEEQIILRDHLAADRTILANERTFLSYIRTALTIVVVGVSLIKFFDVIVADVAGVILIPIGLMFLVIGYLRFVKINKIIKIGLKNSVEKKQLKSEINLLERTI